MESQKTKILLEKYWQGKSSVEEENQLSEAYKGNVGEDESKYSVIFDYKEILKGQEEETFDLSFLDEAGKQRGLPGIPNYSSRRKWIMGLAASVLIAVFSVSYQWPRTQTLEAKSIEMERAYTETLATLQLVADKLNRGSASIQEISVFDRTTKTIIHEN